MLAVATAPPLTHPQITDLARENLGDIKLAPNESNIFQWRAVLPGPAGSPYEGGVFEVDVRVPDDYPWVESVDAGGDGFSGLTPIDSPRRSSSSSPRCTTATLRRRVSSVSFDA